MALCSMGITVRVLCAVGLLAFAIGTGEIYKPVMLRRDNIEKTVRIRACLWFIDELFYEFYARMHVVGVEMGG